MSSCTPGTCSAKTWATASASSLAGTSAVSSGSGTCTAALRRRRLSRAMRCGLEASVAGSWAAAAAELPSGGAAAPGSATGRKSSSRRCPRYVSLAEQPGRPRKTVSSTASAKASFISTRVQVSSSSTTCFCVMHSEAQSRKVLDNESCPVSAPKLRASAARAFNRASASKSSAKRAVAVWQSSSLRGANLSSACSSSSACRMWSLFKPTESPRSARSRFS
mmetsp:Transcript_47774/g.152418  ORF Transcript_47774/g.152418 Transcript_47774/m.152418 type:complete len:221 (-) Transcript_47774:1106-1768(-)